MANNMLYLSTCRKESPAIFSCRYMTPNQNEFVSNEQKAWFKTLSSLNW